MVIYNAANQAKSISTGALVSALQNLTTTTEPCYVTVHSEQFTTSDHENVAASPADEVVIPVGPFVNGQSSNERRRLASSAAQAPILAANDGSTSPAASYAAARSQEREEDRRHQFPSASLVAKYAIRGSSPSSRARATASGTT